MSRRNLFLLASIAVLLAGRGAYADRLGGSYRGPEDLQKVQSDSSSSSSSTGGSSEGSGGSKGDEGGGGGGTGSGGESGGGSGAPEGGGGGGGEGGGEEGGSPASGGPDAGGGGDTGGSKSGGGESGGGGAPSSGSSSSSSSGGRGKAAAAQDQFVIASWYFEHNREQLFGNFKQSMGRRFHIPLRSSAAYFGVLPRDTRQRSDITPEDRNKIFDILKKQLQISPDAVVRDAAALALGKLGTPQAVDLLKAHLASEHDLQVKQDTLVALGLTRSPDAVVALIDALKNDKGGKLTSFALIGLGLSKDAEKAAPVVMEYLNANVRRTGIDDQLCAAVVALGVMRHEDAAKLLAQTLSGKGMSEVVRCYCAQALGRIRGDVAQKALEAALQNGGLEVERAAAIALGSFESKEVAKLLSGKDGLQKAADPLSSGLSAISLGRVLAQIDEEEWKGSPDALREAAQHPEKSPVRAQYANLALTFFGGIDNEMRKFYGDALGDVKRDKDVQSAMAMTAGLAGMSSAKTTLLAIAKDVGRNVNARGYAAMALGMVGARLTPGDTAKSLREIYASADDANVKRGAILGLGFVGDRKDVPFLVSVIDNTKEDLAIVQYTRGAAVIALGMIRDGESIGHIQGLMGKPDKNTRGFALAALGYLADKDDIPAMSEVFENANFRKEFPTLQAVMHQL